VEVHLAWNLLLERRLSVQVVGSTAEAEGGPLQEAAAAALLVFGFLFAL
jgi:hypothetical protein